MPFCAALSEHPDPVVAVAEVVGRCLESLGGDVDVAVLFASEHHRRSFADLADVVRAALRPAALVGAGAGVVVGGAREVEHHPALSLWVATGPSARAVHLDVARTGGRTELLGLAGGDLEPGTTVLLLADAGSFPTEAIVDHLAREAPGTVLTGGEVGGTPGGPPPPLLVGDRVVGHGAAALILAPGSGARAVLAQGGLPAGQPWVVTRAEDDLVLELGGRRAVDRLADLAHPGAADAPAAGLRLGRLTDEALADVPTGAYRLDRFRPDERTGGLRLDEPAAVGTTVRFHRIDALGAETELRDVLGPLDAAAALVLRDAGRGLRLFADPDVEAEVVSRATGGGAVAGCSVVAGIGPIGRLAMRRTGATAVLAFVEPGSRAAG